MTAEHTLRRRLGRGRIAEKLARVRRGLLVACLVAGCSAGTPTKQEPTPFINYASPAPIPSSTPRLSTTPPSPTPVLPQTPAAGCVNPPPNIAALSEQTDPVACYGNAPVTLDAHLIGPVQVDYVVSVAPSWLGEPSTYLEMIGETSKNGPFMLVAIDPVLGVSVSKDYNTNVRITGHFDDTAAQTCREIGRVPGMGTPEPAAGTTEHCRGTFVVTRVVPLQP
jgi:hypothetical protein